jgi:hypothetical protein
MMKNGFLPAEHRSRRHSEGPACSNIPSSRDPSESDVRRDPLQFPECPDISKMTQAGFVRFTKATNAWNIQFFLLLAVRVAGGGRNPDKGVPRRRSGFRREMALQGSAGAQRPSAARCSRVIVAICFEGRMVQFDGKPPCPPLPSRRQATSASTGKEVDSNHRYQPWSAARRDPSTCFVIIATSRLGKCRRGWRSRIVD